MLSKSINYGITGFTLAHEMMHALDSVGRQFNKNGIEGRWWSRASEEQYNITVDKLRKQFSRYTLFDHAVDGCITLDENIADNVGLDISYLAYKEWVKENGEEDTLNGINDLTHDQLFFLSFAQTFCRRIPRETMISDLLTDVHAPDEFRVIGSLKNSEAFRKAFSCKKGDFMYSKNMHNIW